MQATVTALATVSYSFDDEREHGNQQIGIRGQGFGIRG